MNGGYSVCLNKWALDKEIPETLLRALVTMESKTFNEMPIFPFLA